MLTGEEPINAIVMYGQQERSGINLRTYLAGQAMLALISHYGDGIECSQQAIKIADKLIKGLNVIPNPNSNLVK